MPSSGRCGSLSACRSRCEHVGNFVCWGRKQTQSRSVSAFFLSKPKDERSAVSAQGGPNASPGPKFLFPLSRPLVPPPPVRPDVNHVVDSCPVRSGRFALDPLSFGRSPVPLIYLHTHQATVRGGVQCERAPALTRQIAVVQARVKGVLAAQFLAVPGGTKQPPPNPPKPVLRAETNDEVTPLRPLDPLCGIHSVPFFTTYRYLEPK